MDRHNLGLMPFILFLLSIVLLMGSICCAMVKKSEARDSNPVTAPTIPPSLQIQNLQLDNNTRRRTTRGPTSGAATTTATPSPHAINNDNDGVEYRLNNKDGTACILIFTDAIVHIGYVTVLNEPEAAELYMPDRYEPSGVCDEDSSRFTIAWGNFAWTIYFSKTPGGDHWFVEKMELDANTEDKHLAHINRHSTTLHFTQPKDSGMMFPTPVGQAYACNEEISVELQDGDAKASILLRSLVMQPFIFKNSQFGPKHICSPGGAKSYRNETAPIAVGSTFAVVTILTVVGYGVYRYMKVKKVQYDTME